MKLFYLKLTNYRQYRDEKLEFAVDGSGPFTIVEGANGAGKSNLMNALTWCLYGEERHLRREDRDRQLPIVNEAVFADVAPGSTTEAHVEVGLGSERVEYIISRKARVHCSEGGERQVSEDREPLVRHLVGGEWEISEQPNYTVNSILPRNISTFFFFDAERLNHFFKEDIANRVRDGILKVSQIGVLQTTRGHLETVHDKLRKEAEGIDPQVDDLNAEIDGLKTVIEEREQKLDELEAQRLGTKENLEEIRQKYRESPIERLRELQAERDEVDQDVTQFARDLTELEEKRDEVIRELGPRLHAYTAITTARRLVEEVAEKGELPPKVRRPFFEELLAAHECICTRPLSEGSKWREAVEERLHEVVMQGAVELIMEGKFELRGILQDLPAMGERREEVAQRIFDLEEALESAKRRLREISVQIEALGDISEDEASVYEAQHRRYEEALRSLDETIGVKRKELKETENELERKSRQLQKEMEDHRELERLNQKLSFITSAAEVLGGIHRALIDEVREKIERQTQEFFLELIWKKGTYTQVEVADDYQLSVRNARGMEALGSLSAGERQVLALSFMAALATVSGFDSPVVIDTPIGRISGTPRSHIADRLPDYLAERQVTLLFTDTEYTDDIRARLARRVGREYDIHFDDANNVATLEKVEL